MRQCPVLAVSLIFFLRFGCVAGNALEGNFHRALNTNSWGLACCCWDNERKLSFHPYFWYPKAREMEIHWIMNTEKDKSGKFAAQNRNKGTLSALDSLNCKTCKVAANSDWKMAYHCSELLILHFSSETGTSCDWKTLRKQGKKWKKKFSHIYHFLRSLRCWNIDIFALKKVERV